MGGGGRQEKTNEYTNREKERKHTRVLASWSGRMTSVWLPPTLFPTDQTEPISLRPEGNRRGSIVSVPGGLVTK